MNNILNIDLVNGLRSVTSSQSDTNKIEVNIHIDNTLINVYLEIQKQDGSIETVTDLSIENNVIVYEMPFDKYKKIGNIRIKVKAESYESESIIINVLEDLVVNDNIIVKIENDSYVVKKINPKKSKDILEMVYPIGSIYMSVNSTNPEYLFGGTWEQLKDRFLLGAGDSYNNGATGGEATHTLTEAEMPSHSHVMPYTGTDWQRPGTSGNDWIIPSVYGDKYYTGAAGANQAHNNMPPYLVVNMWKRIG